MLKEKYSYVRSTNEVLLSLLHSPQAPYKNFILLLSSSCTEQLLYMALSQPHKGRTLLSRLKSVTLEVRTLQAIFSYFSFRRFFKHLCFMIVLLQFLHNSSCTMHICMISMSLSFLCLV